MKLWLVNQFGRKVKRVYSIAQANHEILNRRFIGGESLSLFRESK